VFQNCALNPITEIPMPDFFKMSWSHSRGLRAAIAALAAATLMAAGSAATGETNLRAKPNHAASVLAAIGREAADYYAHCKVVMQIIDDAPDECRNENELGPDFATAYVSLGGAWRAEGELDRAIADYDRALELDSKSASAFYGRGLAWRAKGQLTHAVDDLAQACRLDGANELCGKSLREASEAVAALAPRPGPYMTDGLPMDALHDVADAVVPKYSIDDLYSASDLARPRIGQTREIDVPKPYEDWIKMNRKAEVWAQIAPFINAAGEDPAIAVVNAIRRSRIVGIGEAHDHHGTNLNLVFGIRHMQDFADAGITDLFIETSRASQPIFDKFNDDPSISADLEIPDHPEALMRFGFERDIAQGSLDAVRIWKLREPGHYELWKAARAAGIRIHAIDGLVNGLMFANPSDPRIPAGLRKRDADMAAAVQAILDDPAGQPRKGLLWLGAGHLIDIADRQSFLGGDLSAAVLLRAKGLSVTTFLAPAALEAYVSGLTTFTLARYVNRAVAVPLGETPLGPNPLNDIRFQPKYPNGLRLGTFDYAILYPHHCSVIANHKLGPQLAC